MLAPRINATAALLLFLASCALSPVHLVNRPAIARCLPEGIRMEDYVERGPAGMKVTVEEKLARLGASPGPDGHLYDRDGRRIEFFRHYDGGAQPLPGMLEEGWRRLRELKKTCTVIEICHDPGLPLPV
jgi:hypothetical protein